MDKEVHRAQISHLIHDENATLPSSTPDLSTSMMVDAKMVDDGRRKEQPCLTSKKSLILRKKSKCRVLGSYS